MALGDVPSWVTTVGPLVGTTIVGGLLAWNERRKGKDGAAHEEAAAVVGAAVISDKGIEKIVLVVREFGESHHDDTRRLRESMSDLNDCMRELIRVVRDGLPPVAGVDLAGMMARLDKVNRPK